MTSNLIALNPEDKYELFLADYIGMLMKWVYLKEIWPASASSMGNIWVTIPLMVAAFKGACDS